MDYKYFNFFFVDQREREKRERKLAAGYFKTDYSSNNINAIAA